MIDGLVHLKRLFCSQCDQKRWHEVLLGMARCQSKHCGYVRNDAPAVPELLPMKEPLETFIERFI